MCLSIIIEWIMLPRKENIIQDKTSAYAIRIIRLYQYLTNVKHEQTISRQILRSGTSIGANTAESRNAQSRADFVNKLNIALKEADETAFWLKTLYGGNYITERQLQSMLADNTEIIRILVKIIKTSKERMSLDNNG